MGINKKISAIYLDDDETLASVVTDFLNGIGLQVKQFHDPDEAIEEMRKNGTCYDLSLIDYRMPIKNGVQVLKEMAEHNFFGIKYNALYSSMALSTEVDEDFESEGISSYSIYKIPKCPTDNSNELFQLLETIKNEKSKKVIYGQG